MSVVMMPQHVDQRMAPARRTLRANWGLLAAAFSDDTAGVRWYLHVDTGEIVRVVEKDCPPGVFLDDGFIGIERARSKEQYRWMQRYIAGLTDRALASELSHAIAGKKAFHRFRAVLSEHSGRTDEWCAFRSRQLLRYIQMWLEAYDLVVPFDPPGDGRPADGDGAERPPAWQRSHFDAVLEGLSARDLESVLALGEQLRLNALAHRRARP